MDKFFSNLGKGRDKKNDDKRNDKKNESSWQGGSGDMDTIKQKNATLASRIDGVGFGGGDNAAGSSKNNNVFANAGAGISDALGKMDLFNKSSRTTTNSRGGGQSLGGSKPGVVLPISLDRPGPLGLEVRIYVYSICEIAGIGPQYVIIENAFGVKNTTGREIENFPSVGNHFGNRTNESSRTRGAETRGYRLSSRVERRTGNTIRSIRIHGEIGFAAFEI